MENRNGIRPIVEAGLLIAITVIIELIIYFLPFPGGFGIFVLPVPMALLYIRYNLKVSVTASAACIIVSIFLLGALAGLMYGATYGITGIAAGYCYKKNTSMTSSLIILAFCYALSTTAIFLITLILTGTNIITDIINLFVDTSKQSLDIMKSMGGIESNPQFKAIIDQFTKITPDLLYPYVPGVLVTTSFFMAFINYLTLRSILRRLKLRTLELLPFDRVYVDNRIGAMLIVVTLLGALLNQKNMLIGPYVLNSSMFIMQTTFSVTGCAVVYYFLRTKMNLRKGTAVFITIVLLFMPTVVLIFYVGLTDAIFDFRKVDPNRLFKLRKQ